MTGDAGLASAKRMMRIAALEARTRRHFDAGALLSKIVLREVPPPPGAIIAGFWPIGDEIDIRPLLFALAGRGHPLVLPETTKRGEKLIFRRWRPSETLTQGRFGTAHPAGDPITPDFALIPLLAFDRQGNRLGYGAGYYDRTLAALPHTFRLGCAFACQEVPAVPAGPDDQRLDGIATEGGVIRAMDHRADLG